MAQTLPLPIFARGKSAEDHAPNEPLFLGNSSRLARTARKIGRGRLIAALVVLLLFLVGWFVTPYAVCDYLNKKGSEFPDYRLHFDRVQINPLTCSVDLYGLHLAKPADQIPVPFLESPRLRVAMQWREILHGTLRSSIILYQPVVNFVQGPTAETTQTVLEPAWVTAVKQAVPLRINRFDVIDGDLHFYDFHADPQIDLEMDHLQLSLDNLTNSTHSKDLMPSTAVMTGRPFKFGNFEAKLALNVDLKQPTFAEKVKLENVPAPALNAFLAKYGSVYAKSGNIAFYTEMVSARGQFKGYIKPFFQNLEFEPMPKDRGGLAAIWASLVNAVKSVLENDKNAVATTVPISGSYGSPDVDFWSAAFGLIKNAFLQELAKGFQKPELAPAPEQQNISPQAIQQAEQQKPTAPTTPADSHDAPHTAPAQQPAGTAH